jgi:hypothetical protein
VTDPSIDARYRRPGRDVVRSLDVWLRDSLPTAWSLAYSQADAVGCSYPNEPAGEAVRVHLHEYLAGIVRTPQAAEQMDLDAVAQCDACFGHCTAIVPD